MTTKYRAETERNEAWGACPDFQGEEVSCNLTHKVSQASVEDVALSHRGK